jgi:hypothetical protein
LSTNGQVVSTILSLRAAAAFLTAGGKTFELPAVDPTAKYEVEYFDGTKKVVSGEELAKLEVKLEPRSFFLAIYKKI